MEVVEEVGVELEEEVVVVVMVVLHDVMAVKGVYGAYGSVYNLRARCRVKL